MVYIERVPCFDDYVICVCLFFVGTKLLCLIVIKQKYRTFYYIKKLYYPQITTLLVSKGLINLPIITAGRALSNNKHNKLKNTLPNYTVHTPFHSSKEFLSGEESSWWLLCILLNTRALCPCIKLPQPIPTSPTSLPLTILFMWTHQ